MAGKYEGGDIMNRQVCVLLDTSFFIRLLNPEEKLHKNAVDYYRYFLEHDIILKVSTIAIAEYCVRGDVFELPLKNMMVLPFNVSHSVKAGKMMAHVYEEKKRRGAVMTQRAIIPNDTKMFAQADVEEDICYYATADAECGKVYDMLKIGHGTCPSFRFIDISIPYSSYFGELDFDAQ